MHWDAIGAIAEALGVIAVFLTLAYIAVQVRDAKDQVKRSIQQVRLSTLREIYLRPAQNPELACVISKTNRVLTREIESKEQLFEAAELSAEEAVIWASYQRAW